MVRDSLLVLPLSAPPEVLKEAPKRQRQVNGNCLCSASQLSYRTYGRTQGNVEIGRTNGQRYIQRSSLHAKTTNKT